MCCRQSLLRTSSINLALHPLQILAGGRYSGPETDIWSSGILLFIMLSGFPLRGVLHGTAEEAVDAAPLVQLRRERLLLAPNASHAVCSAVGEGVRIGTLPPGIDKDAAGQALDSAVASLSVPSLSPACWSASAVAAV